MYGYGQPPPPPPRIANDLFFYKIKSISNGYKIYTICVSIQSSKIIKYNKSH